MDVRHKVVVWEALWSMDLNSRQAAAYGRVYYKARPCDLFHTALARWNRMVLSRSQSLRTQPPLWVCIHTGSTTHHSIALVITTSIIQPMVVSNG